MYSTDTYSYYILSIYSINLYIYVKIWSVFYKHRIAVNSHTHTIYIYIHIYHQYTYAHNILELHYIYIALEYMHVCSICICEFRCVDIY